MLFGFRRVSNTVHTAATLIVAIGTTLSAFWILVLNSWMQTPAGFSIADNGQFVPEDWWAIIFNPSFPYRLAHTLTASYLTTAFMVGGVGAWHLLRGRSGNRAVRRMFSMAMWMAAIVAPVQVFLGDLHGLNTLEHQPVKVMAMEGHYDSHPEGAPLILFGLPNEAEQRVDYAIEIPKLSSLILKHDLDAPLAGLDTVPDELQPPVPLVFWSFRVMIAIGMAMVAIGAWSLWCRARGTLYDNRGLHRAAVLLGPSGLVAVIAGWVTTEVGRQPYTIYGELTTAMSASPIAAPAVATSLLVFIVVYFLVFGAGVFYVLRLMGKAPGSGRARVVDDGPLRTSGLIGGSDDLVPAVG
jgi:cytochrome d ubiquinol oxidase subunit I